MLRVPTSIVGSPKEWARKIADAVNQLIKRVDDVASGSGTVTSVDVSGGTTGITATGGPVTGSGTITLGGTLVVANGGTGATDAATARGNLGAQAADATLTALAAHNTDGILTQTAADTFAGRTLAAPAAGLTITNPAGIAGNPTFALANDLAALEALSGTNTLYYRSGADTWTAVTIDPSLTFSGGTLAASAGAPLLLETLTPSGAASVDIEGFAGGGYALVEIIIELAVSSDDAALIFTEKFNGAYQAGANYRRVFVETDDGGGSARSDATAGTAGLITGAAAGDGVGNAATENCHAHLRLFYPDNTGAYKHVNGTAVYSTPTGQIIRASGDTMFTGTDSTMALQGIRIAPDAGTITGTIKVFGQK